MKSPLDVQEEKQWVSVLEEISAELGMVASLVNPEGRILLHQGAYPEICRRVRANDKTLTFVCSQTSQVLMNQAEGTRQPLVDLCQIGLCKMVIPLFQDEQFLGAVTPCARTLAGEELDPFMVAQELNMDEAEAEELLGSALQVEEARADAVAADWAERLRKMMGGGTASAG